MANQLSALDAFFLYGETSRQAMNVTGIGIYDGASRPGGPPSFGDILEYGRERTRRSSLFTRKIQNAPLNIDPPFWIDDADFDCKNHIFHTVLPSPGTREQLDAEIARIHALTIKRGRPLWEWWFIEGLTSIEGVPPDAFALAFKLHHAGFDGIAAWEVINVSHDTEPGLGMDVAADSAAKLGPARTLRELSMGTAKRAVARPVDLAKVAYEGLPLVRKLVTGNIADFPIASGPAPKTVLNGSLGEKRVHRKVPLRLADIKAMRSLVPGSTLNDVVLTVIGGALRTYLDRRNNLPPASLNVGVPMSIRAKGDEGDAGNQAILSILSLGTDLANPVTRLAAIHERTSAKKQYVSEIPAHVMTKFFEFVPGFFMDAAVRAFTGLKIADAINLPYNLIVTNVPASRVPIYFAGARMLEYDACGPLWDGVRLIHVITSYVDDIAISFEASLDHLPDPDAYVGDLENSIQELKAAAASKR